MNSATWTCPRCGAVHSIYSMTCNCPAPSVATDSTDYVFDLRPMKSERMVLVAADRIAALEAENAALKAERDEALKAARIPSHFKHGLAAWINLLTASSEEADDALGDFGAEVAGLQAQVAALTKERDEAKESARRSAAEVLAVMGAFAGCQRDDEVPHETAMRVVDERADYLDRLGNMIDCYDAARQSRARLVRLVRTLHSRHAQDVSDELVTALTERDAAEDRVRVLEAQLSEAHRKIANQRHANRRLTEDAHRRKGKLAALKSAAHIEARNWTLTANRLIAARQSRARLVNAVREQRELLKAARLIRAELRQEVADLTTEADAARAWAAAWRKAATYERATTMWPPNVKHSTQTYRRYGSVARRADRADRARRAAEAMEQTDGEVKA